MATSETKGIGPDDREAMDTTKPWNTSDVCSPAQDVDIELQAPANLTANARASSKVSAFKSLGLLDRFLAVWILLAMVVGILLGNFVPSTGPALQKGRFVGVSVPIGEQNSSSFVKWLLLMNPISDWLAGHDVPDSVQANWIIAPFLMLGLAWAFLPDNSALREGLILVGLARCIAMVLIWTGLAGGDNEYCAILVAINSILQMVLFAPLSILYLKVISGADDAVSYPLVAKSVVVFLGIPFGAAIITRFGLRWLINPQWYDGIFLRYANPWSLIGLLYTIIILFASQGSRVVHQIVSVVRVAAPLVVYFAIIFFTTLLICYKLGFGYKLSAVQSFTAASNNFELAIAVAIATYGADSDQALAATVGPLIEVPVLLGLVYVARMIGSRSGWRD
ncbi:MAG: hypothetical protein M1818_004343 [Claussenomyces sp. TS43310]|nr:MAG: hypothetical protein M1818_004343 [Claussenomyces sp. TS43310]